jgi:hypothetical protein
MDKNRPNFAEDLFAIREDVSQDIGTILKLAKSSPSGTPTTPPQIDSPAKDSPSARESKPRSRPVSRSKQIPAETENLLNVTTRLSQSINEQLTAAALHQRLKKQKPDTRQAIIEAALNDWLHRHGYDTEPTVEE